MSEIESTADTPRRRRGPRQYLMIAFGVLAVGLLFAAVIDQKDEFFAAVKRLNWQAIVVAFSAGALASVANMLSWRGAMDGVGVNFPIPLACRVFFVSQLGKYVPGSVWPILAQIEITKDRGIPRSRSATGAMVGMAVGVVTSSLVAAVLLLTAAQGAIGSYWYVFVVAAAGLALLSPPVLSRVLRLVARVTKRNLADIHLAWRGLLRSVFWSFVMWAMFGVHAWVIVNELLPSQTPSYWLVGAAFAFSWLAGFLVVIAPAGVGVREAVLVLALGGVLTVPDALALALISRFLLTIVDAAAGGGALAASRWSASHRSRVG